MTRNDIIEAIKDAAAASEKRFLSKTDFKRISGVSEWQVLKHFDSWNEAVKEAGLEVTDVSRIDDNSLFLEMERVFVSNGGLCTRSKFARISKYSVDVYKKHFGKWEAILAAFREWVLASERSFAFTAELPVTKAPSLEDTSVSNNRPLKRQVWTANAGAKYGPFLNFRGLQHAPINEQGVVFLFGMVAFELGYVVEVVRTDYPDCEAKRRVHGSSDQWQRVNIEFEYQSRHFRDHGHDPSVCDLIVCWEHNWPECPLEVLELRSAIVALSE